MSESSAIPNPPSSLRPLMVGRWDGCNLWLQWDRVKALRAHAAGGEEPRGEQSELYAVQVRFRRPGSSEAGWGRWVSMLTPTDRCWRVIQTTRDGWEAQARVAAAVPGGALDCGGSTPLSEGSSGGKEERGQARALQSSALEPAWELAAEATFARCSARFAFTLAAAADPLTIEPGSIFNAQVDGAGCSYWRPDGTNPDGADRPGSPCVAPLLLTPGQTLEAELEALHYTGFCQLDAPGDFVSRQVRGLIVTNLTPSVNDLIVQEDARNFTALAKLPHPGGPGQLVLTGKRWDHA